VRHQVPKNSSALLRYHFNKKSGVFNSVELNTPFILVSFVFKVADHLKMVYTPIRGQPHINYTNIKGDN
ncbi:hypothetical protein, partial [Secundilactobacillus mixtipabuli]|uniref:hypothetical protein n=1 Tax=Secundilactobacillus mixtipabuli TaxID=1435342 RepID=UPI001CDB07D5